MTYANPERKRAYDRKRQAARRKEPDYATTRRRWPSSASDAPGRHGRREPARTRLPFAGVDGEGGGDGREHRLYVLRAGDEELLNPDGAPLRTAQCLHFLALLPKDHCYVTFFFDYDVTMILRDLPDADVQSLCDRPSRTGDDGFVKPVRFGDWLVDWIPRKVFQVRAAPAELEPRHWGRWRYFDDCSGYFQTSFVAALETWGIGEAGEREHVAALKAERSDFTAATPEVRAYNALECRLLAALMESVRDACDAVDIHPANWRGAGSLAGALMRDRGVREHLPFQLREVPGKRGPRMERVKLPDGPAEVVEASRRAYFGGRFEVSVTGPVGPVHEYDIQSAYPTALRGLPCLACGGWERLSGPSALRAIEEMGEGSDALTSPVVASVEWEPPAGWFEAPHRWQERPFAPFLYRRPDGSIVAPAAGRGWQWHPEVAWAMRMGWTVRALEGWRFVPGCSDRPFGWVDEVFEQRIALGKGARGRILKLAMNSLYGKTAQAVGAAPYQSFVWAGLVTAWTRAQLLRAYWTCPGLTVMFATDGIYTTAPVPELDLTEKRLGAWEHALLDDLFVVQPGFYWDREVVKLRTRGASARWVRDQYRRFVRAWEQAGPGGQISVEYDTFVGLRLASKRGEDWQAGEWKRIGKDLAFDQSRKRLPLALYLGLEGVETWQELPRVSAGGLLWAPATGDSEAMSAPYRKGMAAPVEEAMLDVEAMPDPMAARSAAALMWREAEARLRAALRAAG